MVRDDVRMDVVNSLFLPNARAWDIPKLRALFDPNVVNNILKIQLFSGGMDDCWVWSLEHNGMFSVKSCYRVIQDSLGSPLPEASSRRRPLLLWKHLWKMKVPNKIKMFAWRACQNGLPVGTLLQHKPIPPASYVSRKLEDLSVFFSLAWSFWFWRNKFVHEQIVIPPRRSADDALVMVPRFSQIHAPLRDLRLHYKWKAPSPSWLKLNVDGVVFSDLGKSGLGTILRDHTGKVLMAMSQTELEMGGSKPLELMAIFRGL
ncbi:hypothetical protein I3760_01G109400 [Carya illinoinensis]|nr:hypothetical protein I3760_01G109400 [Carya illinoinensis]